MALPPPPTQHRKSDSLRDRKMTNFRYRCSKVFHKLKAISCYTFISLRASSSPVMQQRDHTSARPRRTASHRAAQMATVRRQRGRALDSPTQAVLTPGQPHAGCPSHLDSPTQAVPHTWSAPRLTSQPTGRQDSGVRPGCLAMCCPVSSRCLWLSFADF